VDGRIFGLDIQLGFDVIMQGIAVFIMFALLSYILFEPVRKILEDRKNRIADEIDQAAADQAEAAKLKAEYDHKLKDRPHLFSQKYRHPRKSYLLLKPCLITHFL
jgi:F-type H+-transporting ATPase subunit b